MTRWLLGLALTTALAPRAASAHGGAPAVAPILDPQRIGTVVDRSYTFRWEDADSPSPFGPATVNFYYTPAMPPTFGNRAIPMTLTGTVVVEDILEPDLENRYTWDTSEVPAGTYWIWSRVDEPPEETSPQIISWSPAPLTIAHPGDEPGPAVAFTNPQSPFAWADERFVIRFQAFDPDESAKIRIEASHGYRGDGFFVVDERIPAGPEVEIFWNTRDLPEGDWMLRASIHDCRGQSFTAYGRFFVLVTHPGRTLPETIDAGPAPPPVEVDWCDEVRDAGQRADAADAGPLDGGAPGRDAAVLDAGATDAGLPLDPPEGCGCRGGGDPRPAALLLLLALPRRRRR